MKKFFYRITLIIIHAIGLLQFDAYPDRSMGFDLRTAQDRYMEEMRRRGAQTLGVPPPPFDSDGKRGRS